jgi:hypothetical protein
LKSWKATSNRDLFKGLSILCIILFLDALYDTKQSLQPPKEVPKKVKEYYKNYQTADLEPKYGVMVDVHGQAIARPNQEFKGGWLYMISNAYKTVVGMMAKASNLRYYYANGYFLGFVPFEVSNVYNAMNFVSQRLRYQYDKDQFLGREEIWQTSKEAYTRMRGDCEDHAILLADWLSTLGFDARVATGTYKGLGHAWVVWFHEGKSYIIEATSKRKKRQFPYALMMPDYRAKYMFNKDAFWVREHFALRDDYQTGWRRTSYFRASN